MRAFKIEIHPLPARLLNTVQTLLAGTSYNFLRCIDECTYLQKHSCSPIICIGPPCASLHSDPCLSRIVVCLPHTGGKFLGCMLGLQEAFDRGNRRGFIFPLLLISARCHLASRHTVKDTLRRISSWEGKTNLHLAPHLLNASCRSGKIIVPLLKNASNCLKAFSPINNLSATHVIPFGVAMRLYINTWQCGSHIQNACCEVRTHVRCSIFQLQQTTVSP